MIIILWLIIAIAETNRTPFDFSEGERELVSGFNTEYSSNKFAAVFMAEYARIYFLSSLRVVFFMRWIDVLSIVLVVRVIFF
jgi:NADH-ubiquinone oxidoreductase chain 1